MSWIGDLARVGAKFAEVTLQVATLAKQVSQVLDKLEVIEHRQIKIEKSFEALNAASEAHRVSMSALMDSKNETVLAKVDAVAATASMQANSSIHEELAKLKAVVASIETHRRLGGNGHLDG